MAQHFLAYTVVHQPRRLKLPAQPIPQGATVEDLAKCLFDEVTNKRYFSQVAEKCYYPATRMFLENAEAGFKLARQPRPFSLHTSRHLMRLLGKGDEQWQKYLFY